MSKGNVLITVTWLRGVPNTKEIIKRIEGDGYTVRVHESDHKLKEAEVASLLPKVCGCIVGSDQFTRKALEKADQLSVISRTGAGFDTIDMEACTEKSIVVTNAFGAGASAVAEFTIALIFAVARRLCYADRSLRQGLWIRTEIEGISPLGRTLGIIGLGHIGKEVARLAKGLDMRVIYYDVIRDTEYEKKLGISFVSFDDLLSQSDFVTIHVPLGQRTRRLIREREIRLMKPTAYIFNTSRGALVDEKALYQALKEKRIAGAGIDVFEKEPPDHDNPLMTLEDRVVVTPHMAGLSIEAKVRMLDLATQNLLDVLGGRRPQFVLNPEVYDNRKRI